MRVIVLAHVEMRHRSAASLIGSGRLSRVPCLPFLQPPRSSIGAIGGAHEARAERPDPRGRRSRRDAAALGAARPVRRNRGQVRLRDGPVRGVYGASGWQGGAVLRAAGGIGRGKEDHHHRRPLARRLAPRAGGLGRDRRGPVRLLPVGPDHVGGRPAGREARPQRRGDRPGDGGQHLSLRDIPARTRRHPPRLVDEEGPAMTLSRRDVLVSGAGLLIAFHVPRKGRAAQMDKKPSVDPNAFVRVAPDESVTVLLAHSEMGQGIWTTLAMLIAEELDCDWSKIRVEHAPAAPAYAHTAYGLQMTGGSTTTWSEFDRYRTAGALARAMLVRAAAARWKTNAKRLRTENSFVLRGKDRLSYGQLAVAAQGLLPPKTVELKDRKRWKLLGKPMRRLDSPEKVTGKARFGMDVQFPGLRTEIGRAHV